MNRKRVEKIEREMARHALHADDEQQYSKLNGAGDRSELFDVLWGLMAKANAQGDARLVLDCLKMLFAVRGRDPRSGSARVGEDERFLELDTETKTQLAEIYFLRKRSGARLVHDRVGHTDNQPQEKANSDISAPKLSAPAAEKVCEETEPTLPPLTRTPRQSAASQLPPSWLHPKW